VRPTRCRCSKSHVCRRDSGSIPDVGSSSITTFTQYNHNKQIWLRVQGKNSVLAGCSGIQGSTWRSHRAGGLYGACGLQLHRFHIRCSHQSALVAGSKANSVASAGPYAHNRHLAPDGQPHQHPITQFLQAGCSS